MYSPPPGGENLINIVQQLQLDWYSLQILLLI